MCTIDMSVAAVCREAVATDKKDAEEEWENGAGMKYKIAYYTDRGIKKQTNQDGFIVKGAETDLGSVFFSVVCDGMGGLSKGELASTQVLYAFSDWFDKELPGLLQEGFFKEKLFCSWKKLLKHENIKLADYGRKNNLSLGTTATAFLIFHNEYYIIHVGDSRIYELTKQMVQLTVDDTVVAREIAAGRITKEQAESDPRRNVLLQCIGASPQMEPTCQNGILAENAGYLLCSDGFRHVITPEEIFTQLNPAVVKDEEAMTTSLKGLVETVKLRQETDNITAVYIHT